ncbi:hypothetical protein PoB_002940000 [Plakobranchus ocellatus]|uniref:Uncharacterized protein n=1 Tax=Plakobranchus ocellatus TaxID=259542 RepID=A0AAV4A7T9_9GAST|nr:hypothetical protein PoB_002940000 [Plakobranchus ocellatus]
MRISRRRMSSRRKRMRSRSRRGRKETLMTLVLRIWCCSQDNSEIKAIASSPKDIYRVKSETLVVLLSLLAILLHKIISIDGAPVAQWIDGSRVLVNTTTSSSTACGKPKISTQKNCPN